MKKYGPYDDQARYPHDYFVYQKKSRGEDYEDFEEERPRYERERSGHRYFRFEGGRLAERKKGP